MIWLFTLILSAQAYQIDLLDLEDGKTQIIITDLCQEKFIEIFTPEDIKSGKASKWLKILHESEEIDKCKKTVDSE